MRALFLFAKNEVFYGDGYIYDILGKYKFKISPLSFYQVNPVQTEVLYNTAIELANLNKNETVFDLFCGIGTIGIFASENAKKVYGIEIVEQAIKDAKENAKLNNIDNIEFTAGDVEILLPELTKKVAADVVFIDPPRKGCDEKCLETMLKMAPDRIVYVSCDSATLARDLRILVDGGYELKAVRPCDMFSHTVHVETVAFLSRVIQ